MGGIFTSLAAIFGISGLYVLFSPRVAERLYHPLLFEPHPFPADAPNCEFLESGSFEEAYFPSRNGKKLHAMYFQGPPRAKTVLVCHGNTGNIADVDRLVKLLLTAGASVFVFDYQGFGKSEGAPSVIGICQDAEAAWRHLTGSKGIRPEDIVLYGESLGGAVAVELAARVPAGGLILQSTFTHMRRISFENFPVLGIFPKYLFPPPYFDSISLLRAYHAAPVLILHGEGDPDISIRHGEDLFAAANEPKAFVRLPHTLHAEISEQDFDLFVDSIRNYLAKPAGRTGLVNAGAALS